MSWTREQAIKDVLEASDGFGRVVEPAPVYAPTLLELARKRVLGELLPGLERCAREGCGRAFAKSTARNVYCSYGCARREGWKKDRGPSPRRRRDP